MSLVLETMMVDIGSDGKLGEIEYEIEEWAVGSDDHHAKHFPYSSSPGGKFGEAPAAALIESEWFEASTQTQEPLMDSWGLPSDTFAELETFEFLMPTEEETDAAFAKVLQEQIDAGLERLALTSPKANKKKRPSPMKDSGSTKKRQKTTEKSVPSSPTPSHQQRIQPPRQIKDLRESYEEDALAESAPVTPTKKLSFSETFRATSNAASVFSSTSPPPPAVDWSEAEIVSFEEGLVLFGRPQWKHIAQHMKTKNVHQVKVFAKQYFAERGKEYVPPITEERLQYLIDQFHENKPQKQKPGRKPKKQPQDQKPTHVASKSAPTASPNPPAKRGKTVAPDGTVVSRKVGSGEVVVLNAEEEDEDEIVDIDIDSEHASIDDDMDVDDDADEDEDEDINLLINDDDEDDEDDESAMDAFMSVSNDGVPSSAQDEDDLVDESEESSSSEGVYFAVSADPSHPRAVIISTLREPTSTSSSASNDEPKKLKVKFKKDPVQNAPSMPVHHYSPASALQDSSDDFLVPASSSAATAAAAAANTFFSQEWLEEIHLPPQSQIDLCEDEVKDIEIRANYEFFEGNTVKTPERYLRIRNHIIRAWHPNRDRYVTKTSVRRGLRDCGDVNAIGRVHQFLELIGAINFGLEAPASCRKQGQETPAGAVAEAVARMNAGKRIGMGPAHLSRKKVKLSAAFDAFDTRLNVTAPELFIDAGVSIVVDVHAHLSRQVAVGVLLGRFVPETSQVRVTFAIPMLLDNTINSDLVPGADPGSPPLSSTMTNAEWIESVRAYAAKLHLEVVGMYQSRPDATARMNMDNYLHFKHTFRKTGQSYNFPFVGIYTCAYAHPLEGSSHSPSALSQWHYVAIDEATEKKIAQLDLNAAVPAEPKPTLHVFRRNVVGSRRLPLEQIAQLFNAYRGADNGVDLSELWSVDISKTLLDKLFVSLSSAIYVSEKEKNQFWEQLRSLSVDGVSGRFLARVQTSGGPVWLAKDSVASSVSAFPRGS